MYKSDIETIDLRITIPTEIADFLREANPHVTVPQMCAAIVCDAVTRLVNYDETEEES